MNGISNSRAIQLSNYREIVKDNIRKALSITPPKIALADLIPGISFREIWPLNCGFWTPLHSYRIDSHLGNNFIPRKNSKEAAEWLLTSMFGYESSHAPSSVEITYIGDGASDLQLAKNLAKSKPLCQYLDTDSSNTVRIKLYLLNPTLSIPSDIPDNLTIRTFSDWKLLAENVCENMKEYWDPKGAFLLLDVDRTIILPRGKEDDSFSEVGFNALKKFIERFYNGNKHIEHLIRDSYASSANFPPYKSGSSEGDEDIRFLGSIILCFGLIDIEEIKQLPQETDALFWVKRAINKIDSGELSDNNWNYEKLMNELIDIKIALESHDCSIADEYRANEESILLELSHIGKCTINSSIIDIMNHAIAHNITPIAYSDRPGRSVGLNLKSYYRTRPRTYPTSLIETPLNIR